MQFSADQARLATDQLLRPIRQVGAATDQMLADPARVLIGLDYDGTLAPMALNPAQAWPTAGTRSLLQRLSDRFGTVAILSGRPIPDLLRFLRPPDDSRLLLLGDYGHTRWTARDGFTGSPISPAIAVARRELPPLLSQIGPPAAAALIEDKGRSLGVHTRPTADPDGAFAALRRPLEQLAAALGLVVIEGRLSFELLPDKPDKGRVLRSLATKGARAVVYAGDDSADIPALDTCRELATEGMACVGIWCASVETGLVPQAADVVVHGPAGLQRWLDQLVRAPR